MLINYHNFMYFCKVLVSFKSSPFRHYFKYSPRSADRNWKNSVKYSYMNVELQRGWNWWRCPSKTLNPPMFYRHTPRRHRRTRALRSCSMCCLVDSIDQQALLPLEPILQDVPILWISISSPAVPLLLSHCLTSRRIHPSVLVTLKAHYPNILSK